MSTQKLSVDLTDQNRKTLEKFKSEERRSYGSVINTLIETFCQIPDSAKSELLDYLKKRIAIIYREMDKSDDCYFASLADKAQSFVDIATFLNHGIPISIHEIDKIPILKKIEMNDGYLIIPDSWIVLNPEDAKKYSYAGVIECRNSQKYGIPHFVFFCEFKYSTEYTDYLKEIMMATCCEKFSEFSNILKKQVVPVSDPDSPWKLLNEENYSNAPNISFYHIYVQDDPIYGSNFEPPCGARIVRNFAPEKEE